MSDPQQVVAAMGLYAGSFAVGALSSLIPFVVIDVFVVWVALRVGASPALIPLALLTACGQLAGKLPMYFAARGLTDLAARKTTAASPRTRARVDRVRRLLAKWNRRPHLVLFASAVLGLPPFSILATAAGSLGIRVRAFCALTITGRTLRFAAVLALALAARR
jgi:membrane protein YqaA with SNARE-associated domain